MGWRDLTDGTYLWPEGLAHYIEVHQVRPPAAFVDPARAVRAVLAVAAVDDDWWRQATSS